MATLRRIQRGTVTITNGGTESVTVVIDPVVDTTKTLLLFSARTSNGGPSNVNIAANLQNAGTLIFQRNTTGSPLPSVSALIEWTVIEWTDGVRIQRGTFTGATLAPGENVAIASVDTSKSWPYVAANNSGGSNGNDDCLVASLSSATNLLVASDASIAGDNHYFQVVEYDDCRVLTHSLATWTLATNDSAIGAVKIAKTLLVPYFRLAGNLNRGDIGAVYLTTPTNLRRERATTASITQHYVHIIEFSDTSIVQNLQTTMVDTVAQSSVVIAPVAEINSTIHDAGYAPWPLSGNINSAVATHEVNRCTGVFNLAGNRVLLIRDATLTGTMTIRFQVVEWGPTVTENTHFFLAF